MKHLRLICVGLLLIAACKCNNNKPTAEETIFVIPDTLLVYEINTEAKTIKKFTEVPDSAFTAERVINGLNDKYKDVQLHLIKQSNDTLFVSVPNNEFLGERMGNAGASTWFQDAIINLTSIPGVNFLNIDMERRSHAMPGTFTKNGLIEQFKPVNDSIPAS